MTWELEIWDVMPTVRLNCLAPDKTVIELYDLEKDPSETTDISSEYPEKVKELEAIMDREHLENENSPFIN